MDPTIIQHAREYALRHQFQLAERLGYGMHGNVFVAESNYKEGKTALKAYSQVEPYLRERTVYERLIETGIIEILGFNVPQLTRFDDELLIIEMSIVKRPFVLDFAGAYLDARPVFSEEIWAAWEEQKSEQFETHWPKVQAILEELECIGIFLVDVSPSNIAFLD